MRGCSKLTMWDIQLPAFGTVNQRSTGHALGSGELGSSRADVPVVEMGGGLLSAVGSVAMPDLRRHVPSRVAYGRGSSRGYL